jgi:hypothetical protein
MEGNQTDDQMQSYFLQRLYSCQLSEDLLLNHIAPNARRNFDVFFYDIKKSLYKGGLVDCKTMPNDSPSGPLVIQYWEITFDGRAQYKLLSDTSQTDLEVTAPTATQ